MVSRCRFVQALAAGAMLACAGVAGAHEIIAVSWGGVIYNINPHDGTGSFLNLEGTYTSLNSMAKAPNGDVYAASDNTLLLVDQDTGVLSPIVTMNFNTASIRGMAFDTNGRLYAYNDESTFDYLYSIDVNTGNVTLIGQANHSGVQGFAINSRGDAYAFDVFEGLLTVNLSTGATTDVSGSNNGGAGIIQCLAFDAADQLYGARDALYTISVNDGSFALVGSGGYSDVRGMEFKHEGEPAYSLRVTGRCPGRLMIDWLNATPGVQQALVFGNNQGNTSIPNAFPCSGTILGISGNVQLVDPPGFFSTGSGSGSISGNAGAAACGHYLQLVEGGSCQTSNVAQIP